MTRSLPSRNELRGIARRAMVQRGLLPDFSPAALAEAQAVGSGPVETGPTIRDLRHLPWASIDNDDSRDLDQLSVAEAHADGEVTIRVAVSDVAETVRDGSALHSHARTNTTSVYTAAQVFPMLPERLSTDLTSFGEGEERLALVIELRVTPDGAVRESGLGRASSGITRSWPTTASPPGWTAPRPLPPPSRPFPGSMSNSASRTGWPRRCGLCGTATAR